MFIKAETEAKQRNSNKTWVYKKTTTKMKKERYRSFTPSSS